MGRGGASKDRSEGPDRKCIATGEVQPKYGLIRFVAGPDGQIVPDVLGKTSWQAQTVHEQVPPDAAQSVVHKAERQKRKDFNE